MAGGSGSGRSAADRSAADRSVRSQGYVDYDRHAARCRDGRTLSPEVLARWGAVVAEVLPVRRPRPSTLHVVDVGAGTGIFAVAWPGWTEAHVVAVEPSPAMVGEADRRSPAVGFVRGVAEAIPVADQLADVVWVSTALHHFGDVDRAVSEFARVLDSGGRVLVRTLIPGRTQIEFVDEFPCRWKWERRFHDQQELGELFDRHGFGFVEVREVVEWSETFAQSADWVERMRHVDSLFTALDDDEVARGLRRLRATPDRVGRLELTLVVFERR